MSMTVEPFELLPGGRVPVAIPMRTRKPLNSVRWPLLGLVCDRVGGEGSRRQDALMRLVERAGAAGRLALPEG